MSLSKHQPDLPQLCSLAIFSQMSLHDRISAHQVCPEWYHRVREVNQTTVRPLTITVGGLSVKDYELQINKSENVLRSARLLTNSDGSPQFPELRLTKWNCFRCADNNQQNWITLKQIKSTFPSITELIFAPAYCKKFDLLTEMLQNDHWRHQLISLKVINKFDRIDPIVVLRTFQPLIIAINSLSALKYLTLKELFLFDLPILAQLKKISCDHENTFLNSLQKSAVKNTGELSVEVSGFDQHRSSITKLSKLSDQFRGSLTYLNFSTHFIDSFLSVCTSFPNLSSLSLRVSTSRLSQLFSALSPLHRLQQLGLSIHFTDINPERHFPPPQAQLRSVKALDLSLYLNSDFQVHWLNFSVTMPNLQAIHLYDNNCWYRIRTKRSYLSDFPANKFDRKNPRDVLQDLHHITGLPLNRLSYQQSHDLFNEIILGIN